MEFGPTRSADIDGETQAIGVEFSSSGNIFVHLHHPLEHRSSHLYLSIYNRANYNEGFCTFFRRSVEGVNLIQIPILLLSSSMNILPLNLDNRNGFFFFLWALVELLFIKLGIVYNHV